MNQHEEVTKHDSVFCFVFVDFIGNEVAHHCVIDEVKNGFYRGAIAVLHDVVVEDSIVNKILVLICFEALKKLRKNEVAWMVLGKFLLILEES